MSLHHQSGTRAFAGFFLATERPGVRFSLRTLMVAVTLTGLILGGALMTSRRYLDNLRFRRTLESRGRSYFRGAPSAARVSHLW